MANTPQAKKRIRRNENRATINGARMSRIRSDELASLSRLLGPEAARGTIAASGRAERALVAGAPISC